ncbi:MAG: antibiotic biosynthesis monooxygenase [Rhodanobacteraceae bacterium]|nr:antibiotic biosynthesis monooxygenase [Rhodanobacteraceae bacterium]
MVIFLGRARVRADALEAVLAACREMIARTPSEPGCISYQGHQLIDDPQTIVFVEKWASRAEMDSHLAAPHTQAFLGAIGAAVLAPPVLESFDVAP